MNAPSLANSGDVRDLCAEISDLRARLDDAASRLDEIRALARRGSFISESLMNSPHDGANEVLAEDACEKFDRILCIATRKGDE